MDFIPSPSEQFSLAGRDGTFAWDSGFLGSTHKLTRRSSYLLFYPLIAPCIDRV
jgi:hypothetical protein